MSPALQSLFITLGVNVLFGIGLFIARNWLKARIERGVQHKFDEKIEHLRSDLRNSEEALKKELREREAELSMLRANVLSGASNHRGLLDKRRFEAVERIWVAITKLAPYYSVASMMAPVDIEETSKRKGDPRISEVF